jgi:hypothetical protein
MVRRILNLFVFCLVSVAAASGVTAEEQDVGSTYVGEPLEIGIAALTVNTVTGTIQNKVVKIEISDSIYQREIIETAANSTTQFLFLDETVLTIGPESRLVLDEMFFDPNGTKGKVTMSAMKGLFTFISGSLPSESYEVKTPTMTIGVRGTKFDLFVARNGASTVILRRGAVDVKNLRGVTRRITKVGLATRVSTRRSAPTKPARPSVELENLFKPPSELKGLSPKQVNATRENVEKESDRIREQLLPKEPAKEPTISGPKLGEKPPVIGQPILPPKPSDILPPKPSDIRPPKPPKPPKPSDIRPPKPPKPSDIRPPKLTPPKIRPPKIKPPKIRPPKIKPPKIRLPKIKPPKIRAITSRSKKAVRQRTIKQTR